MSQPQKTVASTAAIAPPLGVRLILPTLTLIGFGVGIWLHFPLIEEHHRRLELHWTCLAWAGEAVAVFWCAHYLITAIWRRSTNAYVGQERASREFRIAMASMIIGWTVDAGITSFLILREKYLFDDAQHTPGTVWKVDLRVGEGSTGIFGQPASTSYHIHARFKDADGNERNCQAYVRKYKETGEFSPPLDLHFSQLVTTGREFPVTVAYDPGRPDRAWLAEVGPNDYMIWSRFEGVSLLLLLMQMVPVAIFLADLSDERKKGMIPWWHQYHAIMPLAGESVVAIILGVLYRLLEDFR